VTVAYDIPAPYFFLSYARSNPLPNSPEENPDKPVETFFGDLVDAVRRHATVGAEHVSGFFDQKIPVDSDWKQFATRALSAAQVFVPLISVAYLTNSWPGLELASFKKRVEVAGRQNPLERLVPVLWAPIAGVPIDEDQYPDDLRDVLDSSVTEPDYADNGLRALLKLQSYHDLYEVVVDRMGKRIAQIAERDPIKPVAPEKVGDIESAFPPGRALPVFSIEIAALTAANAPAGADLNAHGGTAEEWRPFSGQLPLAEYARQLIRRFDFDVRVAALGAGEDQAVRRPGIIMIDPAFVADDTGRSALASVAATLPPWVMPLVIVAPDDEPTRKLAARVLDILPKARALPSESSGRAARGVKSLDEFVSIVPVLVAEAERQYFRHRSTRAPASTSSVRPRLGRPGGAEAPTAGHDS
jgi:FxsC-like protein